MGERKGSGMIEMDEAFFERVYAQVRCVPAGSVCTYGTIAELAGYPKASREVGPVSYTHLDVYKRQGCTRA